LILNPHTLKPSKKNDNSEKDYFGEQKPVNFIGVFRPKLYPLKFVFIVDIFYKRFVGVYLFGASGGLDFFSRGASSSGGICSSMASLTELSRLI